MSGRRIAVVGAGAVGVLYAAALSAARPGCVTLATRRADAVSLLRNGLTVTLPERPPTVARPEVVHLDDLPGGDDYDVVILAVPAYDTADVAARLKPALKSDGVCVSVQNGLDNMTVLSEVLGAHRVVQAATSFAVSLTGPAHTSVDGLGATWLPDLAPGIGWLTDWIEAAGLNPKRVEEPARLVWTKTAIGINGFVCLILNAPLGRVLASEHLRPLALRAAMEIVDVAERCGQPLDREDIRQRLSDAWAKMGGNARSSLFSSLAAGRRTEIEERLGTLVRRAERLSVPVPTLTTIYQLALIRLAIGPS